MSRPFTGAWIETSPIESFLIVSFCRPFTGAWIETLNGYDKNPRKNVAPSRGRGLKHIDLNARIAAMCRPFTGAWIETRNRINGSSKNSRRPFTGAWIETI